MSIKVFILEDHALVREGLINIFSKSENITACGEASSPCEALKLIPDSAPDVILVDLSLPDMTGIEFIEELLKIGKNYKVLVVTMYTNHEFFYRSVKAGAKGLLSKGVSSQELLKGIELVSKNEYYFGEAIKVSEILAMVEDLDQKNSDFITPSTVKLSKREKMVIKRFYADLEGVDIIKDLNISLKAFEFHKQNVLQKFKVDSISALKKLILSDPVLKMTIDSAP